MEKKSFVRRTSCTIEGKLIIFSNIERYVKQNLSSVAQEAAEEVKSNAQKEGKLSVREA